MSNQQKISPRTTIELSRELQSDLAWRRKELIQYRKMVDNTAGPQRKAILRGAVAVLYAHWEGFIKTAGDFYLEFVDNQRHKYFELSINFVAISARGRLNSSQGAKTIKPHIDVVEFMVNQQDAQATVASASIDTGSNLKVDIFKNIIQTLGIDYRPEYALAEKPIIERLLTLRNGIAHGDNQDVDVTEYIQLYDNIDALLVLFGNEVENAAAQKKYLR